MSPYKGTPMKTCHDLVACYLHGVEDAAVQDLMSGLDILSVVGKLGARMSQRTP